MGYELLPVAWSSPRPWGCFPKMSPQLRAHLVFPTPVGVFPMNGSSRPRKVSLPHARGGVSVGGSPFDRATASSPRPWGCFLPQVRDYQMKVVFPTPVGVFPITASTLPPRASLPHARGGVSLIDLCNHTSAASSPRPWGCFFYLSSDQSVIVVFPTPVGVFLIKKDPTVGDNGLPHARGGVSFSGLAIFITWKSSPRPWGCFFSAALSTLVALVFPTPVGVFLIAVFRPCWRKSLPHARGGVSYYGKHLATSRQSSPRPWGCFFGFADPMGDAVVFPTPVGVFLFIGAYLASGSGLPHARGGVSEAAKKATRASASSPRPWGCFLASGSSCLCNRVFPTPVGVFLDELLI